MLQRTRTRHEQPGILQMQGLGLRTKVRRELDRTKTRWRERGQKDGLYAPLIQARGVRVSLLNTSITMSKSLVWMLQSLVSLELTLIPSFYITNVK